MEKVAKQSWLRRKLSSIARAVDVAFQDFLMDFKDSFFRSSKERKPYQGKLIEGHMLVSSSNKGLFCGNGRLSIKESYAGQIICGPPGSNKTTSTIFRFLFDPTGSLFVLDPSGELWKYASGSLQDDGYSLERYTFMQPLYGGYNPLKRSTAPSQIRRVASMLCTAKLGKESKDPFWNIQAESLLVFLIELVKAYPSQYHNLYNVYDLINLLHSIPEACDQLVLNTHSERILKMYENFNSYEQKLQSSITATLRSVLVEFNDPEIASFTSFDTLGDITSVRQKKRAVFISIPIGNADFFGSLVSLLFQQIYTELMSTLPAEGDLPIFMLLEEAGILKLPILPEAMTQARKFRIATSLIVQSESQLEQHYGKLAEAIITSCNCKLYMAGQPIHVANRLEAMMGKRQIEEDDGNKKIVPVMEASEIRAMPNTEALMVLGSNKVARVRLRPYYKNGRCVRRSKLPPVEPMQQPLILPPLLRNTVCHE